MHTQTKEKLEEAKKSNDPATIKVALSEVIETLDFSTEDAAEVQESITAITKLIEQGLEHTFFIIVNLESMLTATLMLKVKTRLRPSKKQDQSLIRW